MSTPTAPKGIQLRVSVRQRDPVAFPAEDEALGARLSEMVLKALDRGVPPPALLVVRPAQVELLDLRPILGAGHSVQRFLASAAGQDEVEAVALLAVLNTLERGQPVGRAAVVFVEWPDNRWWHGYFLLNQGFKALEDMPQVVRRATDGTPRPAGLGGWFSKARFHRLKLQLRRLDPDEPGAGPDTVH